MRPQLQIATLEHDCNVLRQGNEQLHAQIVETTETKERQIALLTSEYDKLQQSNAELVRDDADAFRRDWHFLAFLQC